MLQGAGAAPLEKQNGREWGQRVTLGLPLLPGEQDIELGHPAGSSDTNLQAALAAEPGLLDQQRAKIYSVNNLHCVWMVENYSILGKMQRKNS